MPNPASRRPRSSSKAQAPSSRKAPNRKPQSTRVRPTASRNPIHQSLKGRVDSLYAATELARGSGGLMLWAPVPGQLKVPGSGELDALKDTSVPPPRFYRVGVKLPGRPEESL